MRAGAGQGARSESDELVATPKYEKYGRYQNRDFCQQYFCRQGGPGCKKSVLKGERNDEGFLELEKSHTFDGDSYKAYSHARATFVVYDDDIKSISRYYSFPLTISGPYDDDKPIHLSRIKFIKEYDTFFRKGFYGEAKTVLLKDLKSKPENYWKDEIGHAISPNPTLCAARLDNYELAYTCVASWKISLVYFNDQFSPLQEYLKRRSK